LFLQGEARKEFGALREDIVGCLALVEALIDFGEGEEIEEGVFEEGTCVARARSACYVRNVCAFIDDLCPSEATRATSKR
jgi:tRNA modification GTPase